jgi:hypothetical protein
MGVGAGVVGMCTLGDGSFGIMVGIRYIVGAGVGAVDICGVGIVVVCVADVGNKVVGAGVCNKGLEELGVPVFAIGVDGAAGIVGVVVSDTGAIDGTDTRGCDVGGFRTVGPLSVKGESDPKKPVGVKEEDVGTIVCLDVVGRDVVGLNDDGIVGTKGDDVCQELVGRNIVQDGVWLGTRSDVITDGDIEVDGYSVYSNGDFVCTPVVGVGVSTECLLVGVFVVRTVGEEVTDVGRSDCNASDTGCVVG